MRCTLYISAVCMIASILMGACAEGEGDDFTASCLEVCSDMDSVGLSLYDASGSLYEDCPCNGNILFGRDDSPEVFLGGDEASYYAYSPYDGRTKDGWVPFDIREQRQLYLASGRVSAERSVARLMFRPYFKEVEPAMEGDSVVFEDIVISGHVNIRTLALRSSTTGRLVIPKPHGQKGQKILLPLRGW